MDLIPDDDDAASLLDDSVGMAGQLRPFDIVVASPPYGTPEIAGPERIMREIIARRGSQQFRDALMRAYDGRCAVTGCDAAPALEAAHIDPYSNTADNQICNGLLLRADIHTLFDLGLLRVCPDSLTVQMDATLEGTAYGDLAGRRLRVPEREADRPAGDALRRLCTIAEE